MKERHSAVCCCTLTITALLLATASARAQDADGRVARPPVTIYWRFESQPTPQTLKSIEAELEFLFAPAGVRLEYRVMDAVQSRCEVSAELVAVTVRGSCEIAGPRKRELASVPLGCTHVSDGNVLPFCEVDCDRIREFVRAGRWHEVYYYKRLLYRVIARVVAHELYHVFADTKEHGVFGIAKPAFTARELLFGNLYFAETDAAAMRQRKLRHLFMTRDPAVN